MHLGIIMSKLGGWVLDNPAPNYSFYLIISFDD